MIEAGACDLQRHPTDLKMLNRGECFDVPLYTDVKKSLILLNYKQEGIKAKTLFFIAVLIGQTGEIKVY